MKVIICTASCKETPSETIIAQGAIKRQRAAGQLPFFVAHHSAGHSHVEISQAVAPVWHARGGGAIAHQRNAFPALGLKQYLHRRSIHMNAIGDQFGANFGPRKHGADYAGIPMAEGPHRVKHVRGVPCPVMNGKDRLLVAGVRVAQ